MCGEILFVDDDANLLGAYQRQLRKSYAVLTALGAKAGLEIVASQSIRVVVSDMRMPGMNGLEFLAGVRTISPQTVPVLLSGNSDLAEVSEAAEIGRLFRVVNKPCSRDELLACLNDACQEYERRQHSANMPSGHS